MKTKQKTLYEKLREIETAFNDKTLLKRYKTTTQYYIKDMSRKEISEIIMGEAEDSAVTEEEYRNLMFKIIDSYKSNEFLTAALKGERIGLDKRFEKNTSYKERIDDKDAKKEEKAKKDEDNLPIEYAVTYILGKKLSPYLLVDSDAKDIKKQNQRLLSQLVSFDLPEEKILEQAKYIDKKIKLYRDEKLN